MTVSMPPRGNPGNPNRGTPAQGTSNTTDRARALGVTLIVHAALLLGILALQIGRAHV